MESLEESYSKAKEILKKYNQEQLLLKYEDLDEAKKEILLDQILKIDFDLVNKLYKTVTLNKRDNEEKNNLEKEDIIEPVEYTDKKTLSEEKKEYYKKIGIEEIKKGKLAAVTMAGGQGTRLRT